MSLSRVLALLVVLCGIVFALWILALRSPYSPWYVARWEEVIVGLERMEFVSEDEVNVIVYRFLPTDYTLRLENKPEPLRIRSWAEEFHQATLLINGVYFLEDYTPAGLLITDGQLVGEQKFDLDKSGVLRLDPDFALIDTAFETFDSHGVLEAAQSYPFLLKHGSTAIKEDSGLSARRTFIGTDKSGLTYIGVVWRDNVSLFELMHVLTEMEVEWDDVLNLDGGPSTGLVAETNGFVETLDSAAPVPNVILVEPRTAGGGG